MTICRDRVLKYDVLGSCRVLADQFFEPHLDYFRPADTTSPLGANVDGYYPRPLESDKNRKAQSRYMQNAAYCRLKNVTLGYTYRQI